MDFPAEKAAPGFFYCWGEGGLGGWWRGDDSKGRMKGLNASDRSEVPSLAYSDEAEVKLQLYKRNIRRLH